MMVKPEIIFKSFKRVLKMTWESNVSWSNLNKKNEKLVFCTLKCLLARNYYYYYKRSIIIIYVFIKSWIIGKGIGIGQKILEQWCIATRTVRFNLIDFWILASNDYENKIIKVKQLLCRCHIQRYAFVPPQAKLNIQISQVSILVNTVGYILSECKQMKKKTRV